MRLPVRASAAGAVLAVLLSSGGCARVPRVVVLTDPLTPAEHLDLGVAYERRGETEGAIREYRAAIRGDARLFQARVNLGNVLAAKGMYDEARKEYLEALDLRPKDPEATNNLAWTAVLSGEGTEDALARMEEVASRPGARSPRFLDTLGVLRMRAGRHREADEALAEAENLCLSAPPAESCPGEVLGEIREHRRELRERAPAPGTAPVLLK